MIFTLGLFFCRYIYSPYYEEVIFMKEKARAMANAGYSIAEIAEELGVTEFIVCRLLGKDY